MEEWRDIDGCRGYQVSDRGNVRSFLNNRYGLSMNSHILKTDINSNGYVRVWLGSYGHFFVHRLVASAFIPNPNGYPDVLHKDDDRQNNFIENLEWGTQSENIRQAIARGRFVSNIKIAKEAALKVQRKPVVAKTLNGDILCVYSSICDAARSLNVNEGNISNVLHGRQKKTGVYMFEYADEVRQ